MSDALKYVAIIDSCKPKKSDVIVLLQGDGLSRYPHAVKLYKENYAPKIYFSGNSLDKSYGSYPFEIISPEIIRSGVPESVLFHEKESTNTKEQAEEIIKIAQNQNWQSIIIVASQYHIYRAFLTFLKEILKKKLHIFLHPGICENLSWYENTGYGKRIDLLNNEFKRIETYSQLGHVATYAEGLSYLEWITKQQ